MRKIIILLLLLFVAGGSYSLQISVDAGSFKSEDNTYLETYVRVLGSTVTFAAISEVDSTLYAAVDFTIIISTNGKIVSYEKFQLNSPRNKTVNDFLDVKRFALAPGKYSLKIEAIDKNDPSNTLEFEQAVSVDNYSKDIELSDIQLFGKVEQSHANNPLAKNGIYMEPLNFGVVTEDISVLNIYAESYTNESATDEYFLKYSILDGFENLDGDVSMKKVKKLKGNSKEPLLLQLPVDKMASGNYHVKLEVLDKSQNVLAKNTIDFIRSNPKYDIEYWATYNKEEDYSFVNNMSDGELDYALRAVSPTVFEPKKSLMDYIIKDAPQKAKKKFLFSIWKDKYPRNTEQQYLKYMTIAKAVDIEYNSNVGYGFETDRGYIFMRYGKPNNVLSIDQEPDAYPYEIWYYNFVEETTQTNVRFLFYNKSLAAKDYTLLHTTCVGERQYPQWEIELYRRSLDVPEQNQIDAVTTGEGWNRQARTYFNQF